MQIEESKYKCEIQNFLFLINDNISFTTLTSLLLHLEISLQNISTHNIWFPKFIYKCRYTEK